MFRVSEGSLEDMNKYVKVEINSEVKEKDL